MAGSADTARPTTDGEDVSRRSAVRPATALGVLSTLVCLLGSWHVSFWKDEVDSLSASTRGVDGLWRLIHNIDAVHALYYLTLEAWTSIAGRSEFAARLPSAVATGAATAGVFALASLLGTRRAAWFSATVFLVLPRVTWMGIEARPFAYTATAGVWLTYLFVRGCRAEPRTGRRFWIGYAVVGGIGVTVNIYVALLVVAHGIGIVAARTGRDRLRPWFVAAVGAALLSVPVVLAALGQQGQLGDTELGAGQTVRSIVVNQWFLGNTPNPSGQPGGTLSVDGIGDLWRVAAPLLALVGWALALVAVVRGLRARRFGVTDPLPVLVPAVVVPTVLIAGYSLAVSPMYSARYFCFTAFAVAILIGLGLDALGRDWLRVTALAAVVVLAVPVYASQRTATGKGSDWSAAAAFVSRHKQSGEGVYFTPRYAPDPNATTVGSTSRYIATAYPDSFAGLVDVTLLRTGAQDDSLTGTSRLLSGATSRLRTLDAVWVLRRRDYPAAASRADDELLRRSGLRPTRTWTGPVDTVVEFVR